MPRAADVTHLQLHLDAALAQNAGDADIVAAGSALRGSSVVAAVNPQPLADWILSLPLTGTPPFQVYLARLQARLKASPLHPAFVSAQVLEGEDG